METTLPPIPTVTTPNPFIPVTLSDGPLGLAAIKVTPFSYNEQAQILSVPTELSYRLEFHKETGQNLSERYKKWSQLNNNLALNAAYSETNVHHLPFETYIILTTDELWPAAVRFAEWKQRLGYKVDIQTNYTWTTENIEKTIKQRYNAAINPKYLLLLGDHEQLPGKQDKDIVTDYFYSFVTSTAEKDFPDLVTGRIPVQTLEEAYIVVDKIINYEINPVYDSSFYNSSLHASYFQVSTENQNRETNSYIWECEKILQNMTAIGFDVKRVYCTNSLVSPEYDNIGNKLSDELLQPEFNWNGNAMDVANSFNNGILYALQRNHGGVKEWSHPQFNISHFNLLKNQNKLPVVFSINCDTGAFQYDCFAENLLKLPNGGAVGLFAATVSTSTVRNNYLVDGIFNAIWPEANPLPLAIQNKDKHGLFHLGEILIQGLNNNQNNTQLKAYHCFGDPSMMMYTAKPELPENIIVKREDGCVSVSCETSDVQISFFDASTKESMVSFSSAATFPCVNSDAVSIVISGHNIIPYIEWYSLANELIIQNQNIMADRVYQAEKIVVSSNGTTNIPFGPIRILNGKTTLKAKNIVFDSEMSISLGAELKTEIIK